MTDTIDYSTQSVATVKSFLRIENVSKCFGSVRAVDNLSFDIAQGELFALLGGSGCGKTTLLRMLAGFETPSSGRIYIDGLDVTDTPPYERPVNMMFQSYALFPHMNVEQNIGYGLKHEKISLEQRKARVREMLDLVQLSELGKRKPHQISGGQRQRVALARALARLPKVLLLDEPLGALDKKLREQTQFELHNIQKKTGITFVVVTHDQDEAMTLADRIAVMNKGVIQQIGSPNDIYEFPQTSFVADFIGSINLYDCVAVSSSGGKVIVDVPAMGQNVAITSDLHPMLGQPLKLALRPEKVTLSRGEDVLQDNVLSGRVADRAYYGKETLYRVAMPSGEIMMVTDVNAQRQSLSARLRQNDLVRLGFSKGSAILFEA
ncbi:ABC transporter ATP-binding protein [Thioclava kandeliae]|uniref:Spermidine/putrescine import ATP-binding protein PotA n=1 Tax=Thioclava kandeliae TaxID=3070818 RepID=A0ABV1SLL4_9RHOB